MSWIVASALILLLSSCDLFNGGGGNSKNGPLFLIGCYGNGTTLSPGLYTMSPGKDAPSLSFVTEYYPWAHSMELVDMNYGMVAFRVDRDITPAEKSGIAYMKIDDIENVMFAPIPTAEKDYHYQIANERPRILNDGRIAYQVVYNTDYIYDDYHVGMLAIYDPETGDVEISGDPSAFVLAQPEKGGDTEGGSMSGPFAISPDGRYIYCQVYGYGTDWGSYHQDYFFIVRYEIGKPGSYTRIVQTSDRVSAVTGDGESLVISGDGLHLIDLATNNMKKVDDYSNEFNPGQISKNSKKMFKIWRGSGMGEFDWEKLTPFTQIIQGDQITTTNYRGLGHGAQYTADETKIYFTASTDYYTNYASDLLIYSTPVGALNTTPDSITTIPVEYCTRFFLLLKD